MKIDGIDTNVIFFVIRMLNLKQSLDCCNTQTKADDDERRWRWSALAGPSGSHLYRRYIQQIYFCVGKTDM